MTEQRYSFTNVTRSDLPLLRRWLAMPSVRQWWGDPEKEISLVEEDLASGRMVNLMVGLAGKPFAYVQHYDVHDWPQTHLDHLPRGSRAIDTFIGEAGMLGGGHGSAYLRQLAESLLSDGVPEVVIDPEADNQTARRSFERAGFSDSGWFGPPECRSLVMRYVSTSDRG